MNKRKIMILVVLSVFVIGLTMGSACAATKTLKLHKNAYSTKKGYGGDQIVVYYSTVNRQYSKGVSVEAMHDGDTAYHTKIKKIKVYFKNKKTGKVITKTKKASYNWASVGLKKGYKPYKVKVYYKRK